MPPTSSLPSLAIVPLMRTSTGGKHRAVPSDGSTLMRVQSRGCPWPDPSVGNAERDPREQKLTSRSSPHAYAALLRLLRALANTCGVVSGALCVLTLEGLAGCGRDAIRLAECERSSSLGALGLLAVVILHGRDVDTALVELRLGIISSGVAVIATTLRERRETQETRNNCELTKHCDLQNCLLILQNRCATQHIHESVL